MVNHLWVGAYRDSESGIQNVHPTQKPIALMRWCLDTARIPVGATVCDPYSGSGTTGVACMQTGRRFIGIEIDPGYCAIARRRIAEAANTLWTPEEPARPDPELFGALP